MIIIFWFVNMEMVARMLKLLFLKGCNVFVQLS